MNARLSGLIVAAVALGVAASSVVTHAPARADMSAGMATGLPPEAAQYIASNSANGVRLMALNNSGSEKLTNLIPLANAWYKADYKNTPVFVNFNTGEYILAVKP